MKKSATGRAGSGAAAYEFSARLYDRIYSWKDYAAESRRIEKWIRRYGRPNSRTLLDVACGTGEHLAYLSRRFDATGLDVHEGMLRVARRKLPGVRFVRGRMERLRLGRRFDAITCLFSAIGYVRTESDLRRTLRNFAQHLEPGGIVIVEPWLTPGKYRAGTVHAEVLGTRTAPIVRMNLSGRRGDRSVMDMHHLVATPKGIRHFVEHHDLGMFRKATFLAAFRAAGFRVRFLPRGFMRGRGIYLAVRPGTPRSGRRVTRGS